MRLTERTDYGLRVLLVLGATRGRWSTGELATTLHVSEHHLGKVVQSLQRAGWVRTSRGNGGGVELAVDLATLSVGEVVRRLEPVHGLVECQRPGGDCVLTPACRLKSELDRARGVFYGHLDTVNLGDIIGQSRQDLLSVIGLPTRIIGHEALIRTPAGDQSGRSEN